MKKKNNKEHFFVVAGGTGGHLFPAKVVAEDLSIESDVFFLSDKRGHHSLSLAGSQITPLHIMAKGISGKSFLIKLLALLFIGFGFIQSLYMVIKYKPKAVIGFGGYICVPVFLATIILRKPIIIFEQNAIMGRTNRFFAKYADEVFYGLPLSNKKQGLHAFQAGNPVRKEILAIRDKPYILPENHEKLHILVMGGSLGAAFFAKLIPHALSKLANSKDTIHLTFQCRRESIGAVKKQLEAMHISHEIKPFFENIKDYMEKSHLIISRSGALSVTEMTLLGRPVIFIPYPHATDNHQMANALSVYMKEEDSDFQSCWIYEQDKINDVILSECLASLLKDQDKLIFAAKKIKEFAILYDNYRIKKIINSI